MSFPGLIHFLFIDRSFDELTSPSLSTDGQVVCELEILQLLAYSLPSWLQIQAIPYVQTVARRQGESPAVFLRRKASPAKIVVLLNFIFSSPPSSSSPPVIDLDYGTEGSKVPRTGLHFADMAG